MCLIMVRVFCCLKNFLWMKRKIIFRKRKVTILSRFLSELIGVKVAQEDRGCFVLMTNDLQKNTTGKGLFRGEKGC
ncbi:conserved hypothetical protein [Capnocytophaga canimorsus]|uniref:Uncharacterized protein n=1 Tax=Capnocytophaga canimorsus TaxID=28188 RepID=A0A0B7IGG9_9FLAO|nr:conserved hypothetical protein [Capnocytophaga canimorsus]